MSVAPKPEVLYLPAIFREITKGNTRVPAFQRGFVWRPKQVLELLESVYRYYPIGSLLFWHVNTDQMQSDTSDKVPFPHPEVTGNVDFVLDGMQRISSLYGAFHPRPGVEERDDPFSVVFELVEHRFRHSTEATPTSISLRTLFSPKLLLAEQGRLAALEGGEALVEGTLELHRAFQEYLVPIVRIGDRTPQEVVEIFERVNSTGTRLSAVDFMRALTWSSDFDLSKELAVLSEQQSAAGFDIPVDTIAKSIALAVDVIPTGGELLKLRDKASDDLKIASWQTGEALTNARQFLADRLGILSYDYVPYEGQFLVIVSAAYATQGKIPAWLSRWFWNVAFSEALQGRPDYAVAKLAVDVQKAPEVELEEYFGLTAALLRSRTVRKGAALSMAMIAALATLPCRSIFTGDRLAPEQFMSGYDNNALAAIYSKSELADVVEPGPRGDKLISNIVLLKFSERRPYPNPKRVRRAILELAEQPGGLDALQTQCITVECIEALRRGDVDGFLSARSASLFLRAQSLVEGDGGSTEESSSNSDDGSSIEPTEESVPGKS